MAHNPQTLTNLHPAALAKGQITGHIAPLWPSGQGAELLLRAPVPKPMPEEECPIACPTG